ncbi:MAG TPA: amidohydrolase family protein [Thermodesulfovibrionales bacterium]|nr:amidohydrolase family protein [Thermodesulfovibrionales bacterium]
MKHKGFIDLHTHGLRGYDTRTADPHHILKIAEFQGKAGVAAILPTIYAAPIAMMRENMEAVRKAMEIQQEEARNRDSASKKPVICQRGTSVILGLHLEGPFLNPLRCGALDKDFFIQPAMASLKKLINGYEEIIKIITLAPEMPGALPIIKECRDMGIKVHMGHSEATYKEAECGKRAGATGITHLYNAMRPFHHREPGLVGFGLMDEDIYVEVIADGVHLHSDVLRFLFRIKSHDRIILVSDSVKSADRRKVLHGKEKDVLKGSNMTLSDSRGVLGKVGIRDEVILKGGVYNPERYLGTPLSVYSEQEKNTLFSL